jgi:hypothetical protein
MLVVSTSHDGKLLAENNDAAADRDEDLAHDKVPNADVWLTEINHKALTEKIERYGDEQKPTEIASLADDETTDKKQDARENVESRGNVASFGDTEMANDL